MYELSLFTGIGGGLLGTHLLGWTPVGYVEFNDYCQRVIRQRILDGILPNAPIFGDIKAFIDQGYAHSYTGMVDVITAGFPCQPFSTAGKRGGADDNRNMWPATAECIRIVQPRYALLENVPGLLSSGYFGTILGDLAESGYDAKWRVLSAAELGAPHKRDRLFIIAYSYNERRQGLLQYKQTPGTKASRSTRLWSDSLDSTDDIENEFRERVGEPSVLGMDDGTTHRVDRLASAGNAQVPGVVKAVWELLTHAW